MIKNYSEPRYPVIESDTVNDLPEDIFMLDISADKKCMAVIYKTTAKNVEKAEQGEKQYMLTLYDLSIDKNGQKLTRNTEFIEVNVSYITTSNNPIYIFLSVFGKNGYVALSFVEMGSTGQLTNPSDMFANCIIYGKRNTVQRIPFQGRAVFLKNQLALVGLDTLVVYEYTEKNGFKKKYTLDTQALSMGYEATKHQTEIITDIPWAKYVELSKGQLTPIAGHDIITMSRHIQNNVLVTQYGSKDGNTLRIWSIVDGTLLMSYKSQHVEHVMAISDDYRYIATYDEDDEVARIYCTKTCMTLHTLPINRQSESDSSTFTLSYMRFFGNGRYIITSGFVPDASNRQDHRLYTFEVWCIPAQKLLFTGNQEVYWKTNIAPFAMEFENEHPALSNTTSELQRNEQKDKVPKYGRQYNLPEMKAIFASRENQKITIETKSLFKQDWSKPNEEAVKNWKFKDTNGEESTYKVNFLNNKLLDLKKRSELNDSLDIFKNLFCCSIVNDTDHFILRFGYYTVQLWRLKELPSSVAESEREKIGFQLEVGENKPYFYRSMKDSELVYIRTYKANDYGLGFTFREDWNIRLTKRSPEVLFTENIGHLFINIEGENEYSRDTKDQLTDQNSREFLDFFQKKWPLNKMNSANNSPKVINHVIDVDEIFLPLFNSDASINNSSSNIDLATNSTNSDFHEIESACRVLYHINNKEEKNLNKPELSEANLSLLNDKIYRIIFRLLGSQKNVNFFTTVPGSRTLAMLASFSLGQDLLKYIIKHIEIPTSIFNYTKNNYKQESLLTVLIEEKRYDLFNAFFHRVLIDSLTRGPGILNSLVESLLCLRRNRESEYLYNCFKKLAYIPAKLDTYPVLRSEFDERIDIKFFHQNNVSSIQTFNSCSTLEQIDRYEDTIRGRLSFNCSRFKRSELFRLARALLAFFYEFIIGRSITARGQLCIVPLPGLNDYRIQLEGILYEDGDKRNTSKINEIQKGKGVFERSVYNDFTPFTIVASTSNENKVFKQQGSVLDDITQYKWKAFLRSRFYIVLFIHAIYYVSYSTAVSFPEELYNYTPGDRITDSRHFVSIVLMFISGLILLLQETRQFLSEKRVYLTSFFNWVDIAAFTLPVANLCLLLNNSEILLDIGSVTILILWVHAILRLRAFSYFGQLLEIVIQIFLKIMPFICIMFLVVFAFTHAFIYRLRNMSDQFFQEQYQGGPTENEGNPLGSSTPITVYDTSSQNDFSNPFKAFSVVWFFIYGVFDPVNDGDAGDDTMTKILIILFSFVTILIFSNMVIALMSSTVDDVRQQGNVARLTHFSAVIGELELLWCSNKRKHNRNNNPNYIYYVADKNIVKKHVNELESEYKRLIEELNE